MTTKGQITIPVEIRRELGLLPGMDIEFELDGDAVRVTKATGERQTRGRRLVERLERHRRDDNFLTTDEIMKLTRGED